MSVCESHLCAQSPQKSCVANPFVCPLEAHRQNYHEMICTWITSPSQPMHFCVGGVSTCTLSCEAARGPNGFGSPGCFRGRGSCDCTPCGSSDPVTGSALEGVLALTPVEKIVAMATRRHNELMNHGDTPPLRAISVLVRAQRGRGTREGGRTEGGSGRKGGWGLNELRDPGG